jgi:hypothetical protein
MVHTTAMGTMGTNTRTLWAGTVVTCVLANQHIVYFTEAIGLNLYVCLAIVPPSIKEQSSMLLTLTASTTPQVQN